MKNRQSYLMLIVGLVIGLLLGIAGSSESLFGTATDKDDTNGSASSVAEPSEAYMIDLSAVQPVLAELYPASAEAVNASFAAAEALGADPSDSPAVVAAFQETVLPLVYEVVGGKEEDPAGPVVCFGFKHDPVTNVSTPYLYTTAPAKKLKPIPGLDMPDYWVSNSPTSLVNFQLLACYPSA